MIRLVTTLLKCVVAVVCTAAIVLAIQPTLLLLVVPFLTAVLGQ